MYLYCTTSQFLFRFFIILQCHYTQLFCKFLAHAFSALRIPRNYQFWHFQVFCENLLNFSRHFSKLKSICFEFWMTPQCHEMHLLHTFFNSNVIYFGWKGPIEVQIYETFECLDQIHQLLVIFETRIWFSLFYSVMRHNSSSLS